MKTLVLFPDTNLFLQCRPLEQLPWQEFGFERIEILIGATVLAEIDRFKFEGERRRGRRARAANALFGKALEQLPAWLVVSSHDPEVVLGLAPPLRTRFARADSPAPKPTGAGAPHALLQERLAQALATFSELTQEQRRRYEAAYDEWLREARGQFDGLARRLNARARLVPFQLRLTNRGTVPADELLMEVSVRAGLSLCVAVDDEFPPPIQLIRRVPGDVVLKAPPPAPRGGPGALTANPLMISPSPFDPARRDSRFADLTRGIRPLPRDRHGFFLREDDSEPLAKCSIECVEFRHGMGSRDLRGWIVIPADRNPAHSHLYCRVSARNLAQPIRKRVPIELSYVTRSPLEIAERWQCRTESDTRRDR